MNHPFSHICYGGDGLCKCVAFPIVLTCEAFVTPWHKNPKSVS